MRESFPEFYRRSPEEVREFVEGAKIVLDANVLLALYGVESAGRGQIFDVLEKVKDRLWLPYQAGLEYQRNRLSVAKRHAGAFTSAKRAHGVRELASMEEKVDGLLLPAEIGDQVKELLPDLSSKLNDAVCDFEAAIDSLAEEHVVSAGQALADDPVRNQLDALLQGRVGTAPESDVYERRVKDGTRRYATKVPPGYMDGSAGEKPPGDFLIWSEILEFASSRGEPVLFITNDQKEDWYLKESQAPNAPRPELVREFNSRQGTNGYHQMTLPEFLERANEHLRSAVTEETIERVATPPRVDTRSFPDLFSSDSLESLRRAQQGMLEQVRFSPELLEHMRRQQILSPEALANVRRAQQHWLLSPEGQENIKALYRALGPGWRVQADRDADDADDADASDEPGEDG